MDEYISIKEFATRIGYTTQAVYQRIEKDLQPFTNVVKGKKCINIKAFELFGTKPVGNELPTVDNVLPSVTNELPTLNNELVSVLKESNEVLKGQNEVLVKQMEEKDRQITELNAHIRDLNERLREAQELNRNNQVLLGVEQKQGGFFKRLFKRG